MSASDLPSARRQETRNRLLSAAAEVFVEEGVQGASVESICSRAGFTRGAFYSNFSSKEELFLALLEREYDQRTREVRERAGELMALLGTSSELGERITPEKAAYYVAEFFAPSDTEMEWFVLETEFLLQAMRDPSAFPEVTALNARAHSELADLVESILLAAGRRFTMPVGRAIPILGGIFERALRISAVSGRDSPEGLDELGDRIAELVFAITEEAV